MIVHVQGKDSLSQMCSIMAMNCIEIPPSNTGKVANSTSYCGQMVGRQKLLDLFYQLHSLTYCWNQSMQIQRHQLFSFGHLLAVPSGSIASKLEPTVTILCRLLFLKIPDTPSPILKVKFSSDLKFQVKAKNEVLVCYQLEGDSSLTHLISFSLPKMNFLLVIQKFI